MGTGKMDFFLSLLVLKREKRRYLKEKILRAIPERPIGQNSGKDQSER